MLVLIALVTAAGGAIGWLAFRKARFKSFDIEDRDISEVRADLR